MPRYKVTAKWEGEATREIEAVNEDEAAEAAYGDGEWCGFTVTGGQIDFTVDDPEEIEA